MELNRMLQLAGLLTEDQATVEPLPANVTVLTPKTVLSESDRTSDYSRYLQLAGLLTESDFDEHFWSNLELLEEGKREEVTNEKFGTKILAAWKEDPGHHVLPDNVSSLQVVEYISEHTSSSNLGWIVQQYMAKQLHIANFGELQVALQWFNNQAAKPMLADANLSGNLQDYKTFAEFKQKVGPMVGKKSIKQLDKEQEEKVREAGKLAMESSEKAEAGITNIVGTPATNAVFHAFTVDNKFAAMYFGGKLLNKYYAKKDVAWCTGAMGHNENGTEKTLYDNYVGEGKGKLYIIFTTLAGEKRRFQLHMEKGEYMHEGNSPITKEDIELLCKEHNKEYTEFLNYLIKKYYNVSEEK